MGKPPSSKKPTLAELEEQIPEVAVKASKKAFKRALANGLSVLIVEDDKIVRVHPDGSRETVKSVRRAHRASSRQASH